MQNNEQQQSFFDRAKATAAVARFGAQVGSKPLEFLAYQRPEERYLGISGFFAGLMLILLPLFFSHSNPALIYLLLGFYLIKAAIHRGRWLYRWYKKVPLVNHTRNAGTPLLAKVLTRCTPEWIPYIEPPVAFGVGLLFAPLNHLFGGYVMFAAVCLFVDRMVELFYQRAKLLDAHDRNVEARFLAERLHAAQGQ